MLALEIVRGAQDDRAIPWMLRRATASGHAVLAVWRDAEPATLLGRFHAAAPGSGVRRRPTGGRIVPTGPGVVRLALALPHRSALVSDDPQALRPEQALNRCVRGLLDGCRHSGVDAHYPGRDVVTAGGAPIAWLSLTEEAAGALFEAGVAVSVPLDDLGGGLLPTGLTRPDYGSRRPMPMAAVCEGALGPADVAAALEAAYAARAHGAVHDTEIEEDAGRTAPALEWTIPPAAERVGEVPVLLGRLRAHVGVDDARRLAVVRLSGDVIASVDTVRAIEEALRGVLGLRSELERAVATVLDDPASWVLGIDGPTDVAAAVMDALA